MPFEEQPLVSNHAPHRDNKYARRLLSVAYLLYDVPRTRARRAYAFPHEAPIFVGGLLNSDLREQLAAACADNEHFVIYELRGECIAYAVVRPDEELPLAACARRLEF